MDAVELILKNLDVESVLEYYHFEKARPSGNYIRSACKLHDGDNPTAFVINYETGVWSCHTGDCGSGSIFQLVQKLEGITFPFAVHKVAEILKLDINDLQIVAKTQEEKKELREFLKILNAHISKEHDEYEPQGIERKLNKFKGFEKETIEHFGLKYYDELYGKGSDGHMKVFKKVLGFPISFNNQTIGISLRATQAESKFKWVHQPPKIRTADILYNYDSAIGKELVVVVEGITDVWAYHELGITAVATYGAHISEAQKRLLLQLGSDLVFSFDGDDAGRNAKQKAHSLFKHTSNISFVELPEGKDPENVRSELSEYFSARSKT